MATTRPIELREAVWQPRGRPREVY